MGIDGYTRTSQTLVEGLSLAPGRNFRTFAYDWRLDNRVSAKQLHAKTQEWLAKWREEAKSDSAKVVFVCHSMGGLVVRYASEVLGLRSDIAYVFSLGTPYNGALKAFERLTNGFTFSSLTETVSSFDSIYQLMPTYPCIINGSDRLRLKDLPGGIAGNLDWRRLRDVGLAFHSECESAAKAAKTGDAPMFHMTSSASHATAVYGQFKSGRLEVLENIDDPRLFGDGTVPGYILATPGATSMRETGHNYCDQTHGALQNYAPALTSIVSTLLSPTMTGVVRNMPSGFAGRFSCPDVFQRGESIRVTYSEPGRYLRTVNNTFEVTVVDVAQNATLDVKSAKMTTDSLVLDFAISGPRVVRVAMSNGEHQISNLACLL